MYQDMRCANPDGVIQKCSKCKHVTVQEEYTVTSFNELDKTTQDMLIFLCTNCGHMRTRTLPSQTPGT